MWIFDLDNTLHDARPHIFPSMHTQINDWLRQAFGVDEEGANDAAAREPKPPRPSAGRCAIARWSTRSRRSSF